MTSRQLWAILLTGLSGLSLLLLSIDSQVMFWAGVVVWLVAYLGIVWFVGYNHGRPLPPSQLGWFAPTIMILVAGAAVLFSREGSSLVGAASSAVVIVVIGLDGILRRIAMYTGIRVANLPGCVIRRQNTVLVRSYLAVLLVVPAILLGAAALQVTDSGAQGEWTGAGAAAVVLLLILVASTVVDSYLRRSASRRAYGQLPAVLERHAPRFVFYWDAPKGTAYQVGMWVPYLQRIGVPFFIMVRNSNTFAQAVSQSFGAPVILAPTMADMDRLVPTTLTTAFYSNNGAKNAHFVRYSHLVHVQLLHGDSDKASSYNPITGMFDRIYVAGQAGIDRYVDHDVDIPLRKFRIVGRPQVEDIAAQVAPIHAVEQPVVLYAPTWRGNYSDASYASVPVSPALFDQLLDRGCRILFRPHPYCYRDPEYRGVIDLLHRRLADHSAQTGIQHIYGAEAETEMSVVDCFNACDVMISDVSSVIVDFLFSEKPFALISMGMGTDAFRAEFPLAKVSYVMDDDGGNWEESLDSLLRDDPLAARRSAMREHYLGDFPRESYAEGFVAEARREVTRTPGSPKSH